MEKVRRGSQNTHVVKRLFIEILNIQICKSNPCLSYLDSYWCKEICVVGYHVLWWHSVNYQQFYTSREFKWHKCPLSMHRCMLIILCLRTLNVTIEVLQRCHVCRQNPQFCEQWVNCRVTICFRCEGRKLAAAEDGLQCFVIRRFWVVSSLIVTPSIRTASRLSSSFRLANLACVVLILATDFHGPSYQLQKWKSIVLSLVS